MELDIHIAEFIHTHAAEWRYSRPITIMWKKLADRMTSAIKLPDCHSGARSPLAFAD